MRGARHDFELDRRTHTPHGRSIELDDRLVVAADDQQRRGLHLRQRVACQVWTTAARNHRAYDLRPLGGCDQRCGRTRAGAETGNRQPGHLWMACRPVDGGNDAVAQSIDIKAVLARLLVDRVFLTREQIEQEGRITTSCGALARRTGFAC